MSGPVILMAKHYAFMEWADLIKLGVKVLICGSCCEVKGLKKEGLVEGAEVCCLTNVANAIKTSKQTLVF